jgi:hypothetical protein
MRFVFQDEKGLSEDEMVEEVDKRGGAARLFQFVLDLLQFEKRLDGG